MSRLGLSMRAVIVMVVGSLLFSAGLTSPVRAAEVPDKSDVVMVLDFSASILADKANRDRFATALERHGRPRRRDVGRPRRRRHDREHHPVRHPGRRLRGLHGPEAAQRPGRRRQVRRLPAGAGRRVPQGPRTRPDQEDRRRHQLRPGARAGGQAPAGRRRPPGHDHVHRRQARRRRRPGQPGADHPRSIVREPLADRAPAGRDGPRRPKDRAALEAGLNNMRIIKDMPACVSGATFEWPQTVFQTADEAGQRRRGRAPGRHLHVHGRLPPTPAPTPPPTHRRGRRHPARRPATGRSSCRGPRRPAGSPPPSSTTGPAAAPARATGSNRPRACRSTERPSSRA